MTKSSKMLWTRMAADRQSAIKPNGHVVTVPDGEPAGLDSFAAGGSGRERAEEKAREGDLRFKTFVEQAPVAISVSRDGLSLYANRKLADMLGRESEDELAGTPVHLFFAPHAQAESEERTRRCSLGLATAFEYESVFQRADGSQFPVALAVGRVKLLDGEAYIAFITDITDRRRTEQALGAGKAMRDVTERVALAGSWRKDIHTNVESWSDGMFTLFDVGPGDFDGDATPIMESRVHAADLGMVLQARATSLETGEPVALKFRLAYRDGSEHVVYSEGSVERDGMGEAVAMTGYCMDITDLSEAAARLERAAGEWSETFDAMSDAVAVLDRNGRIVRCNASTPALVGRDMGEIVGRRCEEVFDDGACFDCSQRCSFETGQAQTNIFEQGGRWLRLSCHPQVAAAGHVSGGVLVVTDITQLHQAEHAASERSHFLEQLLKAVPVPVYYLDVDRHLVGYNEAYAASLDLAEDELIGKTVFELRPAELAERMDAANKRLLARPGGVLQTEFETSGPDGAPRYTLSHKAVFSDVAGNPAGIVGVNLDLTGIRRAERQRAATAAQLSLTLQGAVAALGTTTELRDPYTAGHQRRVAELAGAIARRLGCDEARIELLCTAARLHDIGKVVVPAEILAKPGPLSGPEMEIIRQHPAAGAEIVGSIGFDADVAEMILQHHERLDGSGYPARLRGHEILLETRILSVADVVEAMISHRPYRPGLPIALAVAELEDGAGRRYEARACEAAISLISAEGFTLGN